MRLQKFAALLIFGCLLLVGLVYGLPAGDSESVSKILNNSKGYMKKY